MLHELYNEPSAIVDDMIAAGELRFFVSDVVRRKNERDAWDVYLSKVWNRTWEDFSAEALGPQRAKENETNSNRMTADEIVSLSLAVSGADDGEVSE